MKFLIIGLGSIGQRHYRNLHALGFSDIIVYRTGRGDSEFTAAFEREFNPVVFGNPHDALGERPDAVFITNPTFLHAEFMTKVARHPVKGVFVEKPIGHDITAVETAMAEVEGKNILGYVGYNFRFHPLLQKMKVFVDEGRIGRVISASVDSGEYLPDWHKWEDYRKTYPARREYGGGVVLTQSHDLDYLYWFLGIPNKVAAFGGTKTGLSLNVDDLVKGIFEYPNGVIASVHMDFYQRPPKRIFELLGEKGILRWSYYDKKLEFIPHVKDAQPVLWADPEGFERNNMFLEQTRHFVACLQGQDWPRVTMRDGLMVLKIGNALLNSLKKGEVMPL